MSRSSDPGGTHTPAEYRAVVVGCGRIGSAFSEQAGTPGTHSHAQAYVDHPRTRLVSLVDTDPARLAAARARWGVDGGSDVEDVVRRHRPDIVSVCTPDDTHDAVARSVLAAAPPRLLFIEKPIARSADEAAALVAVATASGTGVAVNHSRRFSAAFRAIAEEVRVGTHGAPRLARGIYGKGLMHNGVHAIDLLRLWLGEPDHVSGRAVAPGPDGDPSYEVSARWPGGATAHLDVLDERVATVFELELLCERSRIRFWDGGDQWEFAGVRAHPSYPGYQVYASTDRGRSDPVFRLPMGRALAEAVDNLVGWLDGVDPLYSTGSDGVAALRCIERIKSV